MEIDPGLLEFLEIPFYHITVGRIAAALFLFLAIFLLRRMLAWGLLKLVGYWTRKTATTLDDKLLEAMTPPLRFVFLPIGIWAAAIVLKLPKETAETVSHVVRSLLAIAVFWAFYRATDVLADFLSHVTAKTESALDDHLVPIVTKIVRVIVVIIGAVVFVQEWGYNVGGVIAGLGLGGLAVAMAAKDTVANFLGCLVLLTDQTFVVGDRILSGGVEGFVEEIGFRSTRVRTMDQALVSIPNALLAAGNVSNLSRMSKRRVSFKLGVTYSTSREKMAACLERIRTMLAGHPEVHADGILTEFTMFGESALELTFQYFTKSTTQDAYFNIQTDVNLKVMAILEELGVSCAYPSRSLFLEASPAVEKWMSK